MVRSHILGEWGYCSLNCTKAGASQDNPLYNLASPLYSSRWEEGIFRLYETGHCHTFNPENVSLSGVMGQVYFYLGTH